MDSLLVQTPLITNIINIIDRSSYIKMFVQLPNSEEGNEFASFIEKLEEYFIDISRKNAAEWFKGYDSVSFRSIWKKDYFS